jgi:DNA-binding transcriptional regulator YbjK
MVGTNVPKGEARREVILRATLALIGEHGPDAVTHRAVAERAGVPLSATTYWFESKEALLQETLLLAAREEVERLERLVLELAPRELDASEWARSVAAVLAADLESDPVRHVAFTELVLEGTRRPWLLGQLVTPHSDFEDAIFRPALERLFARLLEPESARA